MQKILLNSSSIQKFNEEKYKLQMFLTPLSKVNSEVELCKSHVSNMMMLGTFPNDFS